MTTLTEQLAPILGQIEGLDIVLFSQQAELVAIKADQERFEQGIYAYEQTNEFIRSLLSPEHLPPSVAPTAMKPVRSIQPSGVLAASKSKTALIKLPENVQQREYFPFQQMSPELILEIFAWCLPHDLVVLQGVSRDIKAILDRNGRLCWTRARNNLAQMPAPPFRPGYSCWNTCEASFTKFCLNSGHMPCFCCGRSVENGLPHLIYRIHVCSRRTCLDNLLLEEQFYIFSDDPQDPLYQKHKAIIPLLSYYLSPERQKLFLVNHAKKEVAWYQYLKDTGNEAMLQEVRISTHASTDGILTPEVENGGKDPALTYYDFISFQHALNVLEWLVKYGHEIMATNGKNQRFLKATMKTERLNYTIALSTPTIRQTLRVFNLSLTRLTMTVWQEIKNQVLKEYIA
ncbi:uncharacterized protein ARMOST_22457 [Armillaria ostoyae]|uniref:Uncharacterized protein n=1 Tax=Armillaria ostoyae TaxID=47428 RepID=A0A284SCX8_ARMOS|nr:uncharacterized protein ARMOST_22457 [Armillaria ostoyae]